jgi:hypothetical protein
MRIDNDILYLAIGAILGLIFIIGICMAVYQNEQSHKAECDKKDGVLIQTRNIGFVCLKKDSFTEVVR